MFSCSINAERHLSRQKFPDYPMPAKTGKGYEQLVNQLLSTPSTRLAILGPDGAGKAEFQGIIGDSRIQDHFGSHCTFVSCDGAPTAGAVLDRLATALGVIVETGNEVISTILEHLAAHNHTLIFLGKLDAIYLPENPEQQDETDIFLATLAAVDELTLIVSFSGATLPECIVWLTVEEADETPSKHRHQASFINKSSTEGGTIQAITSNVTSHEMHASAMLEASHDEKHERLVFQLLSTPSARLAILDSDGADTAAYVQGAISDARVRNHFAGRCAFVSCGGALSVGTVLDCLMAELRVVEVGSDAIVTILNDLAAHDRTLIILNKLDALYLHAESEQQEETDVLLATLAAVDELTLIVTFGGVSLPQSVAWATVEHGGEQPSKPELQASSTCEEPPGAIATQVDCNQKVALEVSHEVIPAKPSTLIVSNTAVEDTGNESKLIYIPAAPCTVSQFNLPPARPAVFHGRDKEVNRLVEQALVSSSAPLGIVGPGGIGKTTLALKVLHHPCIRDHFGKERFFVSCESASHSDDVLGQLASKLDVRRSYHESLWTAVLSNLRSRKRIFVVLDNFETIWSPTDDVLREAAEVFLAQLAVLDELTLVVTTRGNLLPEAFTWANIDTAQIDTLSLDAARMTFKDLSYLKPEVLASGPEDRALTHLLREIDFMPLAINLLARLGDPPSSLLREWSEYHTGVLEADHHDGTRRELSVEVSIKISLGHLPRETSEIQPRQLLSVCCQLPAGLFPDCQSKLGSVIANIESAAEILLRHSLVYRGAMNGLQMLSPVRHYVSTCIPMSGKVKSAVETIYVGLAVSCERPNCAMRIESTHNAAAYEIEIPNIMSIVISAADRLDVFSAWHVVSFAWYCYVRGRPYFQFVRKLLPLINDTWCKPMLQLLIGYHYAHSGDHLQSLKPLEQAAHMFMESGHTAFGSIAYDELALTSRYLGKLADTDSYEAISELLQQQSPGMSRCARPVPGQDIATAEKRYRDARNDSLQAGESQDFVELSLRIFDIVAERGDEAEIIREVELTVAGGSQLAAGSEWLAETKSFLARKYIEKGKIKEAERLLLEAYAIQIGIVSRPGLLAKTVIDLARVRAFQLRDDESLSLLETAADLYQECGKFSLAEGWRRKAAEIRAYIASGRDGALISWYIA